MKILKFTLLSEFIFCASCYQQRFCHVKQVVLHVSASYAYTSDDVIFQIYAEKNNIGKGEWDTARQKFFSKGQPCLRTSPLVKSYGFGIHYDSDGKIALYGMEDGKYQEFVSDLKIKKIKGMKLAR